MKNKRKKTALLAAFAALLATAGLSACGGTDVLNSASETEHEHTYGEWTVTKEATCTEAGSKQRVCGICGKPETETIPAAGHTYEDGICTVCGEKEPSKGLEYTLNSDNDDYSVTGIGSCTDTDIVIPSVYEGKPVTSIRSQAFWDCRALTSVSVGNGVTNIGGRAFSGCSGLTSIIIPDSVTSIGNAVLSNCSGLTSITVAEGNKVYHSNGNCLIETESKTLIAGCKNSVIPKDGSVTSIEELAFYYCNGLTGELVIPDSVTSIGDYAFSDCSGLTSVTLGNGVTDIGVRAFDGCSGLTGELEIPDSVTSIGAYAFYHCSGLTSIVIPDGVTSIEYGAFSDCSSLTSIVIPDCVAVIEDYAFSDCSSLTSIVIPDSVTRIGNWAFSGCSGLTSVTLGNGVTDIGDSAFSNYGNLKNIEFKGTIAEWNAISKGSYWDSGTGNYTITCTDGKLDKSGNKIE